MIISIPKSYRIDNTFARLQFSLSSHPPPQQNEPRVLQRGKKRQQQQVRVFVESDAQPLWQQLNLFLLEGVMTINCFFIISCWSCQTITISCLVEGCKQNLVDQYSCTLFHFGLKDTCSELMNRKQGRVIMEDQKQGRKLR